jgi:hypothetical protein
MRWALTRLACVVAVYATGAIIVSAREREAGTP